MEYAYTLSVHSVVWAPLTCCHPSSVRKLIWLSYSLLAQLRSPDRVRPLAQPGRCRTPRRLPCATGCYVRALLGPRPPHGKLPLAMQFELLFWTSHQKTSFSQRNAQSPDRRACNAGAREPTRTGSRRRCVRAFASLVHVICLVPSLELSSSSSPFDPLAPFPAGLVVRSTTTTDTEREARSAFATR